MAESYEQLRERYKPQQIRWLLIAESPPPEGFAGGSRHFYRTEPRRDDRLFVCTIRALYPETAELPETDIEAKKGVWLERLKADGVYMTEALEESQKHEVTKKERQDRIKAALPRLLQRVGELATPETCIILIKSNVFEVAAEPLKTAGFKVLNQQNVDYPGHFNTGAYMRKLGELTRAQGWRRGRADLVGPSGPGAADQPRQDQAGR